MTRPYGSRVIRDPRAPYPPGHLMGNDYLETVRRRRRRRTWSRRFTTAAWLVAIVGLYALWQWFPDLTGAGSSDERADDTTTSIPSGGPISLEDLDDLTLEDLDTTTFDDLRDPEPEPEARLGIEPIGDWAAPLPDLERRRALRPHHTYAAWDYGARVGTEVYAMTWGTITTALDDDRARCGGTVTIRTDPDAAQMTYCHLSAVFVETGDTVGAGDLLGLSGGQPGAPGAGNTTGAHLHLQIRYNGELLCPQTQLAALFEGAPVSIDEFATTGCIRTASSRFINLD